MKQFLFLFISLCLCLTTYAQERTLSGTVRSEDGTTLIGASVVIKGTTEGTVTNIDGQYKLTVDQNATALEVSYIGYLNQTVAIGEANVYDIVLQADVSNLDEVVVTGLASSVKRSNLAHAIGVIPAADLAGVTTQQHLGSALYGKFKGVNIVASSGAPGGGVSVRLRGLTSINGTSQPLYIIDGIYADNSSFANGNNFVSAAGAGGSASNQEDPSNRISDLDPEDIESIEVLKGASAAAIYGSRASGGVIIITTKKGKAGETKINFSQSIGFTNQLKKLGVRQWNASRVEEGFGADQVPVYNAAVAAGQIFNYEDELYGNTGALYNTRLSVSGGNEKTTFFAAFTRKDEEGIVTNTGYRKTSARLNLTHQVAKFIDFTLSTNYIQASADRGFFNNDNSGTTLGISYISTPSWANLFPDADGNYPNNPYASSNFLQTANQVTNNELVNRFIAGGTINAKIYNTSKSGLKLVVQGGIDYYGLTTSQIFPRTLQFQKNGNGTNGASIQGNNVIRNSNIQAFLVSTYNPTSSLNFITQAGLISLNFNTNSIFTIASQLIGSQTNIDQSGSSSPQQTRIEQQDLGFFIQEEVNWDDKLLVTLGIRGDRSTNNGDENQFYYFPKASVAVNLSEFTFWDGIKPTFNQFKLRFAFGQAGQFARAGAKFTIFNNNLIDGNAGIIIDNTLGNANIEPERQSEIEFGFDLGIVNNFANLDATYYIKDVTDLLLNANLPTSTGFSQQVTNAAELRNEGIEIGLKLNLVRNKDWLWESRFSWWRNTATVTRLDVPTFNTGAFGATLGTFRLEEGKSATQIVGIQEGSDELTVFGDATPDYQLSWQNTLSYKGIEFFMLWHTKQGSSNVNLSTLLSDLSNTSADYDETNLDPTGNLNNGDYRKSRLGTSADVFVEDASYIRLREVGLFYNIPKPSLEKAFKNVVKRIKVGVSAYNLLNFFDYNSYDPEVSNFGSDALSSGVEVTPFPSAKRFFFHFNITF